MKKKLSIFEEYGAFKQLHHEITSDLSNLIYSGDRKFEASCDSFEIQDSGGKKRFVVTDKGLRYDIDEVTYSGNFAI